MYLLGGRFLHLYDVAMHIDAPKVRSLADLEQIMNMYHELTIDEGMTHFEVVFNNCPNFKKLYDCFRDGKKITLREFSNMCKEDPATTVQKLIECGSPHIFYVGALDPSALFNDPLVHTSIFVHSQLPSPVHSNDPS